MGALTGTPEKLLFVFLAQLPWPQISGTLAVAVIALFFITSADSGIYVLNNISFTDAGRPNPSGLEIIFLPPG